MKRHRLRCHRLHCLLLCSVPAVSVHRKTRWLRLTMNKKFDAKTLGFSIYSRPIRVEIWHLCWGNHFTIIHKTTIRRRLLRPIPRARARRQQQRSPCGECGCAIWQCTPNGVRCCQQCTPNGVCCYVSCQDGHRSLLERRTTIDTLPIPEAKRAASAAVAIATLQVHAACEDYLQLRHEH